MFPELFDSRSISRNPRVYKYYRNSIIKYYRAEPSRKITFTEVRKTIVGDVGSIRRVFDFLETWGLINYSPSALNKPLKWEDKDAKSSSAALQGCEAGAAPKDEVAKRVCNHCKSICSIACFVCDKVKTLSYVLVVYGEISSTFLYLIRSLLQMILFGNGQPFLLLNLFLLVI